MAPMAVEIAVQDLSGARIAFRSGATRVELCSGLGATGGLTPSQGMIEAVADIGSAHVLVRTRPGGFQYDADEIHVMELDVVRAISAGARGVVIGALRHGASGESVGTDLDSVALRRLINAARNAASDVEITFHRAFDVISDRLRTLDHLVALGIDRVLTSGGAPRVADGIAELRRLVDAGSGVQIMAGGGLRLEDVAELRAMGVDAIHLSASGERSDRGDAGPGGHGKASYQYTRAESVAAIVAAVDCP